MHPATAVRPLERERTHEQSPTILHLLSNPAYCPTRPAGHMKQRRQAVPPEASCIIRAASPILIATSFR